MKKVGSMRKKVIMALSGGVDSSVAAALLVKEGYDVVGVFIKVWQPDFLPCTWKEDRLDAMRVCASLSIPFLTFDFEKEYKKDVVDYMIREYAKGRTPNPDVMCNRYIKFGAFFEKAHSLGGDYIATGHYAQNKYNSKSNTYELCVSNDSDKDQTYFLWTLTQQDLVQTLFPIGHLKKPEVRRLAQKHNLITARKRDSQGLCFLGKIDMKKFLKHYIPQNKGVILDDNNCPIGTHDGAVFYTIGQRHGFTVTTGNANRQPYFVVDKNVQLNTITVSTNPLQTSYSKQMVTLTAVNWISKIPDMTQTYTARFRYRQQLQSCSLQQKSDRTVSLKFKQHQEGVSRGQSVVIYKNERCLGGGIIL